MSARVVVIGGGPAGLAAGGALARDGVDVVVLEAGAYPRTRLCGEFLSPDAEDALTALGVGDLADRLDAPRLSQLRVTAASRGRVRAELRAPLPAAGRGVSRVDLDAALARSARAHGADVRERSRVVAVREGVERTSIVTAAETLEADAVVIATGRLARPTGVEDAAPRARAWVGVKLHVAGLSLPSVTELHFVRGAYVGLNEVSCGGERRVNVCALARQDVWDVAGGSVDGLMDAIATRNPEFAKRWRRARPLADSVATAAGFTFSPRGVTSMVGARPALICGDAAALIAPLAGDGQAMALTAGVAAARELVARRDAAGALTAQAVSAAAGAFAARFGKDMGVRLRAGRLLQSALLRPASAVALVRTASAARTVPSWLYRMTRGPITTSATGVSPSGPTRC